MVDKVIEYLKTHHERHLEVLSDWLRIPSVSADPQYDTDTAKAAHFIADHLARIGLTNLQRLPTSSNDVIFGEWMNAPGKPTILVYGHYDVQPPDPIDQWESPPFEPVVKQGYIHARGANDNKGQIMLILNAIEAWLAAAGALPVNLKCFIEGDEESGPAGSEAIYANATLLACDAIVIADTAWIGREIPTILYGLRGSGYCEVTVRGSTADLHSGLYGGLVYNPAYVLCQVLAKAKDAEGRILLPGFYDDVIPMSERERANMDQQPVNVDEVKATTGVPSLLPPLPGQTHRTMNGAQPTFEVCGIYGGYTGEGQKTIIPAEARAKINIRLVPGQDPEKILNSFKQFLEQKMPDGVTWDIAASQSAPAFSNNIDDPYLVKAAEVVTETFGAPAVLAREAGSIPICSAMGEVLKVPIVLSGMGLPGDGIHSPHEKFSVEQYQRGAECYARLFAAYGSMK